MAKHLQPRDFRVATSIRHIFSIPVLLISLSCSLNLPSSMASTRSQEYPSIPVFSSSSMPPLPVETGTGNPLSDLTDECFKIVSGVLTPMYVFGGKVPGFHELLYRVFLKSYTTHKDTLELFKMPPLQNTVPSFIYDQGRNRGFVVNITMQGVCDVYKLPVVSFV
jgi:hypothetical protein